MSDVLRLSGSWGANPRTSLCRCWTLVDFHICVDLPHKGTCSHVSHGACKTFGGQFVRRWEALTRGFRAL